MKYIYSDVIPDDVDFFTAGKRYEIFDQFNDFRDGRQYQVMIMGDDEKIYGPVNVGWPCSYLNDRLWNVEEIEDARNEAN
jgi:hypothetical protein